MKDELRKRRVERHIRLYGAPPEDSARTSESPERLIMQDLHTRELMVELCRGAGITVLGSPETAFATFDEKSGTLYVTATSNRFVKINDFSWFDEAFGAIDTVEALGARFVPHDGKYLCILEGHGNDCAEAARALIEKMALR